MARKQEADPARSRRWFPRRVITSAPTRDVIGLATEEGWHGDWIVAGFAGVGVVAPRPGYPGSMTFTRITARPEQMGGVPCIRGLRVPVATVVGLVAEGMADAEVLAAFPDLEVEDIREALEYAAAAVRERELPLAPAG